MQANTQALWQIIRGDYRAPWPRLNASRLYLIGWIDASQGYQRNASVAEYIDGHEQGLRDHATRYRNTLRTR